MKRLGRIFRKLKYWFTVPYEVEVQTKVLNYARKRLAETYPGCGIGGGILSSSQLALLGFCLVEGLIEGKGRGMFISDIARHSYFRIHMEGNKQVRLFSVSTIQNAAQQLSALGLIEYDSLTKMVKGLTKKGKTLSSAIFSPIISLGWILGFLIILMLILFIYVFLLGLLVVAASSILNYAQLFMVVLITIGVLYTGWFFIPTSLSLWWRKRLIDKIIVKSQR